MARSLRLAVLATSLFIPAAALAADPPRNVVLFVPDGLRSLSVNAERAPAMERLKRDGVYFRNSHSVFPTFTMANASALATGHHLGDTGAYANTIYSGHPVAAANGTVTPFIENNAVLGEVDAHFGGDHLDEETLLKAARRRNINTVAIGKLGPTLEFDHTERTGQLTAIVDDQTGTKNGIPLAEWMVEPMKALGLPLATPNRGPNGQAGDATRPGATEANVGQQRYFQDIATKIVLPKLKADGKPFLFVFWSRDPDGTQHGQGDSHLKLEPGINGPTSLAAIRNADDNLAAIRQALADLGLDATTDVIVSADHGFSTISKQSETSPAAKARYGDTPEGLLPPGFVAIDLARALGLPLFDPDRHNQPVGPGAHPLRSNGALGADPAKPDVVVAGNGGSDLIYLPSGDAALARRIVEALLAQDYVSGLFVDDALGPLPGALPLSLINLKGRGVTPAPAIVVSFRSVATGCAEPVLCTAAVADSGLQQGQGMHGSFSRADTWNFMAAAGPSFKRGFVDDAPTSNADVGMTIAQIMGLTPERRGDLVGRPMGEALAGGASPEVTRDTIRSEPAANGLQTILNMQSVGPNRYFSAAGFPGRTVGLDAGAPAPK